MSATIKSRIFLIGHGAVLDDGTTVDMNCPVNFYVMEGILYDRCLIPGFFQTFAPPIEGFTFEALSRAADIKNEHIRLTERGSMKEHLLYAIGDNLLECPKFRIKPAETSSVIIPHIANHSNVYNLTASFPLLQAPIAGTIDGVPVRFFSFKADSPFKDDIAIVPSKPLGQPIKAIKLSKIAEWADAVYNKDKIYEVEFHWLACRPKVISADPSELTLTTDGQ